MNVNTGLVTTQLNGLLVVNRKDSNLTKAESKVSS